MSIWTIFTVPKPKRKPRIMSFSLFSPPLCGRYSIEWTQHCHLQGWVSNHQREVDPWNKNRGQERMETVRFIVMDDWTQPKGTWHSVSIVCLEARYQQYLFKPLVGGFNHPSEKYARHCSSKLDPFPQGSGWKFRKIWNHHLDKDSKKHEVPSCQTLRQHLSPPTSSYHPLKHHPLCFPSFPGLWCDTGPQTEADTLQKGLSCQRDPKGVYTPED